MTCNTTNIAAWHVFGASRSQSHPENTMISAMQMHFVLPQMFRCFSTQTSQSTRKLWRVSSLGRVCNSFGIVSYGSPHASGYRYIWICGQSWPVHRAVMITFRGPPTCKEAWQVHHVDGDRANNSLENLEYVTPSQNSQHSHDSFPRRSNACGRSKPVMSGPIMSKEWTWHPSIIAAAQQHGLAKKIVSRACATSSPVNGHMFKFPYQDIAGTSSHPGEEWRPMLDPLSGAEVSGRMVSSFGRISSKGGHISRGHLNRIGYRQTGISLNGRYQTVLVHRLVAAAFLGRLPQAEGCTNVNHKDLDKSNNAVDNLEYVTPAENIAHFHAHAEGVRRRMTGFKPVWSKAYGMNEPWKWHPSLLSAANALGLHPAAVSHCARGKRQQTGNYEFQFAEVPEWHPLPGEEWRDLDVLALQRERQSRL